MSPLVETFQKSIKNRYLHLEHPYYVSKLES